MSIFTCNYCNSFAGREENKEGWTVQSGLMYCPACSVIHAHKCIHCGFVPDESNPEGFHVCNSDIKNTSYDNINHPSHYNRHPSGVECIDIVKHYDFLIGNAIKYLWRAGLKDGSTKLEDLKKAAWYVDKAFEEESNTKENK